MKEIYREVCCAAELQRMVDCTITAVYGQGVDGDEGLCIDCLDKEGNSVNFLLTEEGTMHLYDSTKKSITAEQFGEIAMLAGCSDIDSINFNNAEPLIEIIIRVLGPNTADRVITILSGFFPRLQVSKSEWDFEGKPSFMYLCSDPDYDIAVTVAVIPKEAKVGV